MSGTAHMASPGANDNRLELQLFQLAGPQPFGIRAARSWSWTIPWRHARRRRGS